MKTKQIQEVYNEMINEELIHINESAIVVGIKNSKKMKKAIEIINSHHNSANIIKNTSINGKLLSVYSDSSNDINDIFKSISDIGENPTLLNI